MTLHRSAGMRRSWASVTGALALAASLSACSVFQPLNLFGGPEESVTKAAGTTGGAVSTAPVAEADDPASVKEYPKSQLPQMHGSDAEPGSVIGIFDNGKLVAKVPVEDDGTWKVPADQLGKILTEGSHDIQVATYDASGRAVSSLSDVNRIVITAEDSGTASNGDVSMSPGTSAGPTGTTPVTGPAGPSATAAPGPATTSTGPATGTAAAGGTTAGTGSSTASTTEGPGPATVAPAPARTAGSPASPAATAAPTSPPTSSARSTATNPATSPAPTVTPQTGPAYSASATATPAGTSVATEASNPEATQTQSLQIPQTG
ncbi:hypothetical protein JT358_00885 [Micrococcales bacterium 31B]|nr:hypothetical protein [Micrococcales bacterium 31B]